MDSVGDYIYFIIIIIAAISGIIKKKKPQTVFQTTEPDEEDEVEMEEINKPFIPKEVFEEKYKNYEVNYQPLSFDTATDFSKLKAHKQVTLTSKFNIKNSFIFAEPEEEIESEYKFETLDDFKKAIIYTEIFNRKY